MEATWDLMFTEHFKKDVDKFSGNNIKNYLNKLYFNLNQAILSHIYSPIL